MHIALHNAPDLTQPITVIELILLAVIIAQINQDHVIQYDKGLIILRMPYKNKTPLRLDFGGDSIVLRPDVALSTTMVLNKDMRSQLPAIIDSLGDLFGKPSVKFFVKPIEDYVDSIC